MSGRGARSDRHVLLELDALLEKIQILAADGDRERFDKDDRLRKSTNPRVGSVPVFRL